MGLKEQVIKDLRAIAKTLDGDDWQQSLRRTANTNDLNELNITDLRSIYAMYERRQAKLAATQAEAEAQAAAKAEAEQEALAKLEDDLQPLLTQIQEVIATYAWPTDVPITRLTFHVTAFDPVAMTHEVQFDEAWLQARIAATQTNDEVD